MTNATSTRPSVAVSNDVPSPPTSPSDHGTEQALDVPQTGVDEKQRDLVLGDDWRQSEDWVHPNVLGNELHRYALEAALADS
jgi:hypothetical protein